MPAEHFLQRAHEGAVRKGFGFLTGRSSSSFLLIETKKTAHTERSFMKVACAVSHSMWGFPITQGCAAAPCVYYTGLMRAGTFSPGQMGSHGHIPSLTPLLCSSEPALMRHTEICFSTLIFPATGEQCGCDI